MNKMVGTLEERMEKERSCQKCGSQDLEGYVERYTHTLCGGPIMYFWRCRVCKEYWRLFLTESEHPDYAPSESFRPFSK